MHLFFSNLCTLLALFQRVENRIVPGGVTLTHSLQN